MSMVAVVKHFCMHHVKICIACHVVEYHIISYVLLV